MKKRTIAFLLLFLLAFSYATVAFAYNTGDDYPSEYKTPDIDTVVDRWNFYNRECTSFAAWCLNSRNGVAFTNQYGGVSRWGHAKTWGTVAQGLGIAVNSTPAVGAIAWWNHEPYGHVAWVSAVNGDSVTIEEYNWASRGNFGSRTISSSNPAGFIHISDIPVCGTLDVNTILDGTDTGAGTVLNGVRFGTFDVYINGSLKANDADDIAPTECTSYEIKDIKPTTGHIYSGSVGSLSGTVAPGQAVTVKLKFDTCTNHTYDSGVVTKATTCADEGIKTFTCTKCGATKEEKIAKLAHTPVIDPAVPATVTSTGLTEGSHCSVCNTVLVEQQVVDKLPRVLNDFDMDGVADPVVSLPNGVKIIEEEAFAGNGASVIMIPEGVTTIGSRAFADMPNLKAVFLPESIKTVSFDIFDGSPDVTLYLKKGSRWGARLDLPFVEIDDGWVAESDVPIGAIITEEKWSYTLREYTESSYASLSGWIQYDSKTTWTDWSGWQNSKVSGNSDRQVETRSVISGYDMISYCVSGPNGRSYQPSPTYSVRLQHGPYWWSKAEFDSARVFVAGSYFDYASNVAGYVLDATGYCKWDGSDTGGYVPMFIQNTTYETQWRYRDATHTYYYYRELNQESTADPSGQDNITDVQKWVKYSFS